jgi:spore photoproduct lyase
MYTVSPERLYAMDFALRDERNVARFERLVRAMGREPAEVPIIGKEDLPEVIRASGWIGEVRQGAYPYAHDPDVVFGAFEWATPQQRAEVYKSDLFRRCAEAHTTYGDCAQGYYHSRILAMLGAAPFHHYEQRPRWDPKIVCWSLHDIHSGWGCFHRCAYCQRGSAYAIMLNVEEFVEHVDGLLAESPWQDTIRYDVEQDVLAIEPEYGACRLLVEDFARREGRYLILFSKSANVDFLLPLEHRGHTIMLWTLTTRSVSRRIEPRTATMEERLEAARRCQEAGYTVRFKFKPIVPLREWREETTEMLERLFEAVQPDNLSMEVVFFDSVAEMDANIGLDNLDPRFVDAAREAERTEGPWDQARNGPRPFTSEVKQEIYEHFLAESRRLSPSTPITLCAETQRMWNALGDTIAHCTPGLRELTAVDGPDEERVREAVTQDVIPS